MDAAPTTAIVIAGGAPTAPNALNAPTDPDAPFGTGSADGVRRAEPPPIRRDGAIVIAADGGLSRAIALGLDVDLVVGDLDSVDPDQLDAVRARGAAVERHPTDKDAIDLELALEAARRAGAGRVIVIDGGGGRLDLLAANLLLLASPAFADLAIEALVGAARVFVVRDRLVVGGRPGDRLTLLPVNGPARRIVTDGLRYPLRNEDLTPGTTRGCSNELVAYTAVITLEEGTLLCVLPDPQ